MISQLLKSIYEIVNMPHFNRDFLSSGQLDSKQWLVKQLSDLDLDLGTVFICAGWYGSLATLMFENGLRVDKIRSFDIDPDCSEIADTINIPWVIDGWRFKSITQDIMDINYENHKWQAWSNSKNRLSNVINDQPNTIINTSCEHIKDFDGWYRLIPAGKLVVLQSNNYFEIEEHVNCSESLEKFVDKVHMTRPLYSGELVLPKYNRYMVIGIK